MKSIVSALVGALYLSCLALPSQAQEDTTSDRKWLGYGLLFTNDLLGDGKDRWQTGSVASSRVWGPEWTGHLPEMPGEMLELRFNGALRAPASLTHPAAGDRPYAASLSLGLHTHFDYSGFETSLVADLVFTGPKTGVPWLQTEIHDLFDEPTASQEVRDNQIGNGLHPTAVLETGHTFGDGMVRARPFVEGRWGDESLVRAGLDITFGLLGHDELWVREPITGQRYRTVRGSETGFNFVIGGDIAHVYDSIYLPGPIATPLETRRRARAGINWQGEKYSAFYGLTWLGKEFTGQPDDQVVGAIQFQWKL